MGFALASLSGCGLPPSAPVEPATELPMLVRFVHGQGSEDLLSVGADGAVTGWLGPQDGDRPVGCVVTAAYIHDLADAAANDLEPGATEPAREGADFEHLEVTGRGGTAWMGDGGHSAVVRAALRLVREVEQPEADRTFCRATPRTTPGDLASGAVLQRWSGPSRLHDAVLVSTTGAVTGRTREAVVSCEVPEATAQELITAPVPQVVPPEAGGDIVRLSVTRSEVDHPLTPTGGDRLTTTALALLDDLALAPEERTLCTPRS